MLLYPYWWYFRDYPNKLWLDKELTRDLLDYPVIIQDDSAITKTQAILKNGYVDFQYKRLVWPMQDYFNLKSNGMDRFERSPVPASHLQYLGV